MSTAVKAPSAARWAVDARQAVADARAKYQNALAAERDAAEKLRATEARLAELNAAIAEAKAKPPKLAAATVEDIERAFQAADRHAASTMALEQEAELFRRKLPMIEGLVRKAGDEVTNARLRIGDAERKAWKALADSLAPQMLDAAALVRRWRLAMREAGCWPHDPKDVGGELLEGDGDDNRRMVEAMRAELALEG